MGHHCLSPGNKEGERQEGQGPPNKIQPPKEHPSELISLTIRPLLSSPTVQTKCSKPDILDSNLLVSNDQMNEFQVEEKSLLCMCVCVCAHIHAIIITYPKTCTANTLPY